MKITVNEIAERIGRTRQTVRAYIKRGWLPSEQGKKRVYVDRNVFEDWYKKNQEFLTSFKKF